MTVFCAVSGSGPLPTDLLTVEKKGMIPLFCVRLEAEGSCRYPNGGKLVEINSHSLFSKWFSESGKLVQGLFSKITNMIEDGSTFVVVMIGASRVVSGITFCRIFENILAVSCEGACRKASLDEIRKTSG